MHGTLGPAVLACTIHVRAYGAESVCMQRCKTRAVAAGEVPRTRPPSHALHTLPSSHPTYPLHPHRHHHPDTLVVSTQLALIGPPSPPPVAPIRLQPVDPQLSQATNFPVCADRRAPTFAPTHTPPTPDATQFHYSAESNTVSATATLDLCRTIVGGGWPFEISIGAADFPFEADEEILIGGSMPHRHCIAASYLRTCTCHTRPG